MRPVAPLLGLSAAGLAVLAVSPLLAIVFAGVLILAGVVIRARGDRVMGLGIAATGIALLLAAVLVLTVVDTRQDEPVIIGPDRGLTPGTR